VCVCVCVYTKGLSDQNCCMTRTWNSGKMRSLESVKTHHFTVFHKCMMAHRPHRFFQKKTLYHSVYTYKVLINFRSIVHVLMARGPRGSSFLQMHDKENLNSARRISIGPSGNEAESEFFESQKCNVSLPASFKPFFMIFCDFFRPLRHLIYFL
jgi:hypothetical protein